MSQSYCPALLAFSSSDKEFISIRFPSLTLQTETSFYRILAIVAGVIAFLKGFRLPYSWAASQAQIDYRSRFLRRGFFGEVCRQLHIPIWHYLVFSIVSFLVLFLVFYLMWRNVHRSGLDGIGLGSFTALIAGSFAITYLTNVVGFHDVVMMLLVLVILPIRQPWLRLGAVLLFGVIGVMIHELYAIAFLPISLLGSATWAGARWKRWLAIGFVAVIPWLIVYKMAATAEMTPQQVVQLEEGIQARVDFRVFGSALDVLGTPASENRQLMKGMMHAGEWWVQEFLGLLAFLPLAVFFLAIAWRMEPRFWVRLCMLAVTFSPLLLNFVAFDRYRWLMMMSFNGVFCAISVAWDRAQEIQPFSIAYRRAAILLAVSLSTNIGFFMGTASDFPFQNLWNGYRHGNLFTSPR